MSSQKTFHRALRWAYTMHWGQQGFTAFITFVLASILGPGEFGTVAIAMIYIMFIQMIVDQGLAAALIQRKNLRTEHLDSVFWMVLVVSLILAGVSAVLGRWWAAINHLPQLSSIILLLSVSIPIEGLTVVQKAILQREMDFKSLSIRGNISVLAGGVVGIAMALRGFGVWALVGQQLSMGLVALILLWRLSHWRPHLRFSAKVLSELLGFSIANFFAKLGVFASTQADVFVLGVFFGPVAVGLYRLADRLVNMVLRVATQSLQVVSFPQFSRLQDDPEELKRSVLSCVRLSSIVVMPALAGLAVISDLIMLAIGEDWAVAGDVLKILCVLGMVLALEQFTGPILQALSRPLFLAVLVWGRAAAGVGILVTVAILLKGGSIWEQIVGIASARFAMEALLFAPIFILILMRVSRISIREFFVTVGPSLSAAGAVASTLLLFSASGLSGALHPFVAIAANAMLGMFSAAAVLFLLDGQLRSNILAVAGKLTARRDRQEVF